LHYCYLLLSISFAAPFARAAHVDILPYFQDDGGQYSLRVGAFDLLQAGNVGNGLPTQPITQNNLVFGGAFGQHPRTGELVNGNPGWGIPSDAGDPDNEGYGAAFPAGTLPPYGGSLKFNVVVDPRLGRNLSYWNGVGTPTFGPVPSGEIVDIYRPVTFGTPPSVTLDGSANAPAGFEISSNIGPGSFHAHTGHVLWGDASRTAPSVDAPAEGFYLFSLNMEIANGFVMPNFPDFAGAAFGLNSTSPTFHVLLAWGFDDGSDQYYLGDIIYQYQYDEFGELLFDDEGNPLLLLDEFGNPVSELDEFGNPLRDTLGYAGFQFAPEMQAAVDWVHANLQPVPEPGTLALGSLGLLALVVSGRRLRRRTT